MVVVVLHAVVDHAETQIQLVLEGDPAHWMLYVDVQQLLTEHAQVFQDDLQ